MQFLQLALVLLAAAPASFAAMFRPAVGDNSTAAAQAALVDLSQQLAVMPTCVMTCADQAAGNSTTHANITTAFEPTSQTVLITCATTTCPADAAIITKAFQGPVTSDCTTIMAAGPSFNSTLPPPTKITTSIPVITGSITGSITAGLPSNAVTASAVVTTTALTTTMNSGANGDRVNPAVAAVMVVAFGAMLL